VQKTIFKLKMMIENYTTIMNNHGVHRFSRWSAVCTGRPAKTKHRL